MNSDKLIKLLKQLKPEMHGAVVESMKNLGLAYNLNYGVSLYTIQNITTTFSKDHTFGLYLLKQEIRELILCGCFIADSSLLTLQEYLDFSLLIKNTEVSDVLALHLVSPSSISITELASTVTDTTCNNSISNPFSKRIFLRVITHRLKNSVKFSLKDLLLVKELLLNSLLKEERANNSREGYGDNHIESVSSSYLDLLINAIINLKKDYASTFFEIMEKLQNDKQVETLYVISEVSAFTNN